MISKAKTVTDSTKNTDANNSSNPHSHLHGAAVIDANGKETPITEQMIQAACNKLIRDWESSLNPNHLFQKTKQIQPPLYCCYF